MKRFLSTGAALAIALSSSTSAFAVTSVNGTLDANGVFDYLFHWDGGFLTIAVDSAGINPIFDPQIYLFNNDGSPLSAKTGALMGQNDDFNGLNSFLSFNPLVSGNYILSVGRFAFNLDEARSADAGGAGARGTFDVTFSSDVTPNGAVPEPATWALMLIGFGMIGGVMRARRRQTPKVRFAF